MSFKDKTGIPLGNSFRLASPIPMDDRTVVEDETELQYMIDNASVYEGLEVYVKSLGKKMQYNGTEFVEVATGGSNVDIHIEDDTLVINTDGTSSGSSGGSSSGNTGSGITKNTYEVNPSNISIDLTSYIGGVNFVVNNDNGLSNFMLNNRDNMMKVKIKTQAIISDMDAIVDYEYDFTKTSGEAFFATISGVSQIGQIQLTFGGQGAIPINRTGSIGLGQIGDYVYNPETSEHVFRFSAINTYLGEQDGITFSLAGFTIEAYSL